MKEIEVTVSLRNNRLKERRLQLGLSQKKLAACIGVSRNHYAQLETMSPRISPFNKTARGKKIAGEWSDTVKKIAAFYLVDPSDLFPNAVIAARINKAIRKIDSEDIPVLLSGSCDNLLTAESSQLNPEEIIGFRESMGWYKELAFPHLSKKEQAVVKLRFDHDLSLTEIARGSDRSIERIRQIQKDALRKLRSVNYYNKINRDLSQD